MPCDVHEQPLKERRKEKNEQTLTIYNSLKCLENIYSQTRQQKIHVHVHVHVHVHICTVHVCTCMYIHVLLASRA